MLYLKDLCYNFEGCKWIIECFKFCFSYYNNWFEVIFFFSFYVSIRCICLHILALEFCSSLISRLIRKYDICNGKQVDASNFCQKILRCFNHCLLVHQELLSYLYHIWNYLRIHMLPLSHASLSVSLLMSLWLLPYLIVIYLDMSSVMFPWLIRWWVSFNRHWLRLIKSWIVST